MIAKKAVHIEPHLKERGKNVGCSFSIFVFVQNTVHTHVAGNELGIAAETTFGKR